MTRVIIASSAALSIVERTGDRRAERDLDRDDHAAFLVGVDDPAQPAQRDRPRLLARAASAAVHRPQHPLEHEPHVVVGPRGAARATAPSMVVVVASSVPRSQTSTDTVMR